MCIASVRDCRALADAQPVDVTKAKIPWVMRSQAGKRGERGRGQHGVMLHGVMLHGLHPLAAHAWGPKKCCLLPGTKSPCQARPVALTHTVSLMLSRRSCAHSTDKKTMIRRGCSTRDGRIGTQPTSAREGLGAAPWDALSPAWLEPLTAETRFCFYLCFPKAKPRPGHHCMLFDSWPDWLTEGNESHQKVSGTRTPEDSGCW